MDKKNTVIGAGLLILAFVALYLGQRLAPPPVRAPEIGRPPAGPGVTSAPADATATPASQPQALPANTEFAAIATENAGARVTTLTNDYIEVNFTDFGGAIRDVALRKYPAELGLTAPYLFNGTHVDPILAFTEESVPGLGRGAHYQLVSSTGTEIVYRAVLDNRLEVTRRYAIHAAGDASGDPYVIRHETTLRNLTDKGQGLPRAAVSLGTASLLSVNDWGQYLNVVGYDGSGTQFTNRGELEGSGFVGRMFGRDSAPKAFIEKDGAVVWASVKNQFFASIYASDKPGTGIVARRVEFQAFPGARQPNIGLTGAERFDIGTIPAGGSATLAGNLFVGPKEYPRLARLPNNQDKVMQFDSNWYMRIFLCGYVAPFMNTLMNWTHRWVNSWGFAIILMTLIIKTVSLPFTLAASRSARRMQKFQPEIAALRTKYKDNPQKLNQATMELFKAHRINPMGGCLPLIITMPLFIGFFTMLQGTAELRFQPFLWAHDLSAPDTILRLYGIPLNIMPLLMGATMLFQMRLTPQPTVDNAQAKMMKFMPLVFMLFCYSYSCALSVYMTVNGLFTIGQQLVINRMKDDEPVAPAAAGGMKNVTPAKKKGRR